MMKKIARKNLDRNWLRKWYREKFNLPPNDPLYLKMTDEDIEIEYHETSLYNEQKKDAEQESLDELLEELPKCTECDYRGYTLKGTEDICPKCGSIMEVGVVYIDDGFDEYKTSVENRKKK